MDNCKTEAPILEVKPKTIELIIKEISAQVYDVEQNANRLAGIEERLQGSRPEEVTEDICKPSNDHLTMLNYQVERLRTANRSMESLIGIIETIL